MLALAAGPLAAADAGSTEDQIRVLREQIAAQREQIQKLETVLEAQSKVLEALASPSPAAPAPVAAQHAVKIEDLAATTESTARNLGGFRFSGDFRFRLDAQLRSGNSFAAPLQNVRGRYRFRLNIDKQLDPRFNFHVQLSTAPFSNAITNDQDMAGMAAKHPISIAEAFVDFHPGPRFSMRGGRMPELFADNMRFLWDDDVRFNGFQQTVKVPLRANTLGFNSLELRAGEYILSNPAVYVLAPTSPYVAAGYQPGQKVRDADLFHPGVILRGDLGTHWSQQVMGTFQFYRNANQIQLASTSAGVGVVVNPVLGLTLPGGLGAAGSATTTPGGAIYSAGRFQIAHLGYRLEHKGMRIGGREMPGFLDFQASRNVGTGHFQDAFIATANLGAIRKAGDVRFLYQYARKDANSLVSQFTDDDLGTGSGVNISVHALRFDVGLARFLEWQNLFFVQEPLRGNDPANHFFVPLPLGANTTFRYLGQLAFTF